jgi:hypothetical protein
MKFMTVQATDKTDKMIKTILTWRRQTSQRRGAIILARKRNFRSRITNKELTITVIVAKRTVILSLCNSGRLMAKYLSIRARIMFNKTRPCGTPTTAT